MSIFEDYGTFKVDVDVLKRAPSVRQIKYILLFTEITET